VALDGCCHALIMGLQIAAMTLADLDDVDFIERTSFKQPWSRDTFVAELARSHARLEVSRLGDRVVGFSNYWLVADEASLLVIAVHPDHRRRGVASGLLEHLLIEARAAACTLVTLEVRRGNQPAISLYQRHGFATSYVRKRYYSDGEDALVMDASLA
jgi:[ribosomal protein S18]-alanine N-acetyltransferase